MSEHHQPSCSEASVCYDRSGYKATGTRDVIRIDLHCSILHGSTVGVYVLTLGGYLHKSKCPTNGCLRSCTAVCNDPKTCEGAVNVGGGGFALCPSGIWCLEQLYLLFFCIERCYFIFSRHDQHAAATFDLQNFAFLTMKVEQREDLALKARAPCRW